MRTIDARILDRTGGLILILDLGDGKRWISVRSRPGDYVAVRECETRYPVDLIELILRVKSPGSLCDEIMREESDAYLQNTLRRLILSHVDEGEVNGSRVLDFGCGGGASTMILARMFPDASIVGLDIDPDVLSIARARLDHYRYPNVELRLLESSTNLSGDLRQFDFIVLSALLEHLLPQERESLIPQLWRLLTPGGLLLIGETPHRYSPLEIHTTGLPLINYLPARLALRAARTFSPRVSEADSWQILLRRGIRGSTRTEIIRLIVEQAGGLPEVLTPTRLGTRDPFDLWYELALGPPVLLKRIVRAGLRSLHAVTGVTFTPYLALALRKSR